MVARKPSRCYLNQKQQSPSRKEYCARYPELPDALRQFVFGNIKKTNFPAKILLTNRKEGLVSDRAIMSVRVTINNELKICLGESNYRFQIKAIPFYVVRNHGLIGIAKAERMQKGMRLGFGTPVFRCAKLQKGNTLFEINVENSAVSFGVARRILDRAKKRLPPLEWEIKSEGVTIENIASNVKLPEHKKERTAKGGEATITRTVA